MAGNKWTRENIVAMIRHLHSEGVDLSPTGIRRTHGALFSSARSPSHFASWREAIRAAGLDYNQIKRGEQVWSRERITRAIRKAHEEGEDLLSSEFKKRHKQLYSAACARRYFGSWRRAIESAGLGYDQIRGSHFWSRERIVEAIREIRDSGQSLNWSAVNRNHAGLYRAARRRENYGSWQAALEAAGVVQTPRAPARQWTRRRIIEEIRRLHRESVDLSQKSVMASHGALLAAAKSSRYFGTWRRAVEAAGIDYDTVRRRRGRPTVTETRGRTVPSDPEAQQLA